MTSRAFHRIMRAIRASGGGSGTVQNIVSSAVVGIPMSFVGSGSPIQWKKNGVNIAGATSAQYTPVSGDAQATLTVTVNGTTSAGVIVAPASAAYTTALAAVTDGQYFTAPSAANSGARLRVYQRVAGVGVLYDVTAASGVVNAAWAAVQSVAKPSVTPLVDFDSASAFYGEREFQSLTTGVGARTLNLLNPHAHAKTQYKAQGTITVNPRVTDSLGGTNATEILIASGSVAASDFFMQVRCPPGTWTFAVDVVSTNGVTQTLKIGYNGTTTLVTGSALSGSASTISQTFNLTTETVITPMIIHGDYPSAAASNYQFRIENLRLIPGTSAAGVNTTADAHPAIFTSVDVGYSAANNGLELESLTADASSGNMLGAKLATLQNLTAWTVESTVKATAQTSTANGGILTHLVKSDLTGTGYSQGQYVTYAGPPASAQNYTKVGGSAVRDTTWQGMGRITYTLVAHAGGGVAPSAGVQTGVDVYMNGMLIENFDGSAVNVGTQSSTALAVFNSLATVTQTASGGTAFSLIADMSGGKVYSTDLTAAQVANSYANAAARATAKGLSMAAITSVVMPTGDSITYGLSDTGPWGFINRALSGVTNGAGNSIPVAMQAKSGENLAQYVTRMNATIASSGYVGGLQQCANLVAAGVRVIVTVMIGTNDDSNLTSQANVEAFYAGSYLGSGNCLKNVYAAWRAAGAKVVALTLLPNNRGFVFESGTGAVSGTPGSGTGTIATTTISTAAGLAGQTFSGWRAYLNALIKSDASVYDAVCDVASESHFAGIYPNINGGVPAGVEADTVHPNPLGNAYVAVPLNATLVSLIV